MSLNRIRTRITMNLICDAIELGFDINLNGFERIELEALIKSFADKREQDKENRHENP